MRELMTFLLALTAVVGPLCLAWFVVVRFLETRPPSKKRHSL
jgi:hypothetical protein